MSEQMQDLARRAVACKHWRWMPGMQHGASAKNDIVWFSRYSDLSLLVDEDRVPNLTDPATIGCLLALVREAWGEKKIGLEWEDGDSGAWLVTGIENNELHGETEAEALVVALEAAP